MAAVKPCPDGMNWVNPYLTVKSAEASLDFYARAFGFEKKLSMPGPDGKLVHAEMVHRTSTIMFGPENPQYNSKSPNSLGGTPVTLFVYCENVDSLATRAKGAGATVMQEPQDMFWGDRVAILKDPDGHVWWFATHFKDFSPKDCRS